MAQIPTTFERVLADFKKDLTPEEVKEFGGSTLNGVKAQLIAIQEKQKQGKIMQNLTRIRGFLEAIETYSKVLDVFVNVHEFVAFIWGPFKWLLLTASALSDAFNRLLDAYKAIAERLPLLEQYQSLFGTDQKVELVLELTFRDIFEFHREALRYFRKPSWKLVFHATWNKFNSTFGDILKSLDLHKQLLIEQASLEHFAHFEEERVLEAQNRKIMATQFDMEEEREKRKHLAMWLAATESAADHERIAQAREHSFGSCQWILRKDLYRSWCDPNTAAHPLLWINGIPGAGKSVLASFIIDECKKLPSTNLLFFYFRSDNVERNSFVSMARTLLWTLAQRDSILADLIFQESNNGEERLQLRTRARAESLLETTCRAAGQLRIILDGLDEIPAQEQKHVVSWCQKLVTAQNAPHESRCVILSQFDETTKPLLAKYPTIRMMSSDNAPDIAAYCANVSRRIEVDFALDALEASEIASKVAIRAEGMFLFAKLAMSHLSEQTNPYDLRSEMEQLLKPTALSASPESSGSEVFEKLDIAYSRILARVAGPNTSRSRREDASRLLKWLSCALRPLTWHEIQTALCIDGSSGSVDSSKRRRLDAKDLCGSLIEIGPRGEVELVHTTAKIYLERARIIYPPDEHLALAFLCLEYFCLPIFVFDAQVTDDQLDRFILQGAYGFLDYAFVNWTTHMERGLLPRLSGRQPPQQLFEDFKETLQGFFGFHWQEPKEKPRVQRRFVPAVQSIDNQSVQSQSLQTMSAMHRLTTMEVQQPSTISTLKILPLLLKIRERMEYMLQNDPASTVPSLETLYGQGLYKCPRMYCRFFHQGFSTFGDRQTHVEKHERSYYCPHASCVSATLGWTTKKELDDHILKYHPTQDTFPEEEREADQRAGNSAQKNPATFQCNLCPKTFTRAYNLRSHLRAHTDERPFVCTICGKSFGRQHDRRRHEALHSGERKFICKGTLQTGSQWGCGRRFNRADGLGRHFRTEAGRVCIKPLLDEEAAERQRAWMEEQQKAAEAASLATQEQQPVDMMGNFLPAALLQQYPALAGIDWSNVPQGPPPDEDAYSGRSAFDASSGGDYYDDYDYAENELGYQNQTGSYGGTAAGDSLAEFEGR